MSHLPAPSPSLTALPSEIRLQILDLVITSTTRSAPQTLDSDSSFNPNSTSHSNPPDNISYKSWSRGESLFFPTTKSNYRSNVSGLLSTCRLLRAEAKSRLKYLVEKRGVKLECEVDFLVDGAGGLWGTWTRIPWCERGYGGRVDELRFVFRVPWDYEVVERNVFCERGRGEAPCLGWVVFSVIERVLGLGVVRAGSWDEAEELVLDRGEDVMDEGDDRLLPVSRRRVRPQHEVQKWDPESSTIDKLVINVQSITTGADHIEESHDTSRLFLNTLQSHLSSLLRITPQTKPYSHLLLTRLGSISLLHNEVECKSWDLGHHVACSGFSFGTELVDGEGDRGWEMLRWLGGEGEWRFEVLCERVGRRLSVPGGDREEEDRRRRLIEWG